MYILCRSHLFNISKTLIQVINANLVSISNRSSENIYKVDIKEIGEVLDIYNIQIKKCAIYKNMVSANPF